MNRRQLLKYLLSTPLAATLDYEKLLWVPGQQIVIPSIFIPSQAQLDFINSTNNNFWYGGMAGGGKSIMMGAYAETWFRHMNGHRKFIK